MVDALIRNRGAAAGIAYTRASAEGPAREIIYSSSIILIILNGGAKSSMPRGYQASLSLLVSASEAPFSFPRRAWERESKRSFPTFCQNNRVERHRRLVFTATRDEE